MKHIYNDGGRAEAGFKGEASDCVVRAVAIATRQPYAAVYNALHSGCKQSRGGAGKSSPRNGVKVQAQWFKSYMRSLGWTWIATMGIGTGCTVHLADGELPNPARLIVSVSRHYVAVIDGVIHDTHDPSRNGSRCVYGYWMRNEDFPVNR